MWEGGGRLIGNRSESECPGKGDTSSLEEEKLPPALLVSVAGPKNKTDIRQTDKRKAYSCFLFLFFFLSCT